MQQRFCTPLITALTYMRRQLEYNQTSLLIVASKTLREFRRQPLPDHLQITRKKRRGERTAIHGLREYKNRSFRIAHWPEDAQEIINIPSLICVTSGQADFHIGDYFFRCKAGDILLIPAGVPQPSSWKSHIWDGDPQRSCTLLWMCPKMGNNDGMECWLCHSHGEEHEIGRVGEVCWIKDYFIIQLFHSFCNELQSQSDRKTAFYLLCSLFALTQQEIETGRVFLPGHYIAPNEKEFSDDVIEQACSYIDSHLHQQLSIEKLARHVYVSPATFTRKFRQQTGWSFYQYLIQHRIERAASLLLQTDWSVSKIGEFVGLRYSALRRLFISHYGCPPGRYRESKKVKKQNNT